MRIIEYSVKNSRFTLIVTLCLVALGVSSFRAIPRLEDPSLKVPSYNVVATYPGADAKEIEQQVARPLEDAFKELDEIDKIRSTVKDGFAFISVEFFYGQDPEKKYDEVLRQVSSVRSRLPNGVNGIDVRKVQTIDVAMMQVALVSEDASYGRLQDLAESLRKRFESVHGVRQSQKLAFPEKQVRVSLDMKKVAELGLPLAQIMTAVQGDNTAVPGGAVELDGRRFNIKTSGSYTRIDQIQKTPVASNNGAIVYLGDIAQIEWTTIDLETFGRYNGKRAVFVTARPLAQQNLSAMSERLRSEVEKFRATLPGDVQLEIGWDQSSNVENRLSRLEHDFLIALGLVLLTVLPLGFRASLLVMMSIPLSLAMGVTALYFTGFSLNQLSIVGCVIALGLLVDDSIVVVENIARFRREGVPPLRAAIDATRQISVAVVGTTATLLFAFLPLMVLPGGPGQFIRSLPVAVAYAVLASLVVALTITPLMASLFLRGKAPAEGGFLLRFLHSGISRSYRPILHWCMGHRWIALGTAAALVVASFALVPRIGFSLFPKAGTPQFLVKIEAEEGASVAATDAIARRVETILTKNPDIVSKFTTVGDTNAQIYYNERTEAPKANVAQIFAAFKSYDPNKTPAEIARLRHEVAEIPGAQIVVKEFENGPPIEAPIAIRIFSDNLDELARMAARVETLLRNIPGTHSVNNPVRVQRTDLRVEIDKPMAAILGVPESEIDRAVRLAFAGLDVSRFLEDDGDQYNIQIALPRGDRGTLDNWPYIQVRSSTTGAYLPVTQVARLDFESAPPVIQRYNRERSVTVTAFVENGYNPKNGNGEADRRVMSRVSWLGSDAAGELSA
ncbi:MAG TPA: efflux RND transporter permease subunit [Chthoniobacterales bacterium]